MKSRTTQAHPVCSRLANGAGMGTGLRTILSTSIGVAAVCAALLAQQTAAAAPATAQGIITVKEFRNITGTAVTDLTSSPKFPDSPDLVAYVTYFEWPNGGDINTPPVDTEDNYGTQVIGYFYPPTTGNYVFFVCSDDNSELYLSEDDTAAKKHLIARETVYSNPREYQTSAGGSDLTAKRSDQFTGTTWPAKNTITLTAGKAYYIEALHKEGTGGDNISAAVQDPLGMIDPTLPIPGTYLSTIDRLTITQPYLKDFTGNFGGVWFYITEPGDTVNRTTAKLTLNGADVPITFTTVDSQTISASYRVAAPLAAGSTNTVSLQFTDSASRSQTISKQFVVAAYATLPPGYATTTFSGNGMKVYSTQINFVDALGNLLPGRFPGDVNGTYNAERQIAGDFKDDSGVVYPNAANPVNSTVQTVNWELSGGDITATPETGPDHFNSVLPAGSPRPNAPIPGGDPSIVAPGDGTGPDNMAIAVTTFLGLKQGFNRLVVNSDDGFTLRASPGIGEVIGGALLGSFDTGRGASDTWCEFWVQQDGVYPVRLLYWQGSGGASCEWFAETPESLNRILVNDRTVTGALMAYDTGTGRAYTKTVLPYPNEVASRQPDFKYQIVDDKTAYVSGSFKLTLDGAAVSPTVSTSAGTTTATFTAPAEVPFGSAHTVAFEWVENTTPPTTNAFSYAYTTVTFTVADLPANSFWIEVEDFDFNNGQSLPEASVMPYQGGAYADLTSPRPVLDTDYHRDNPGPQNNPPTDLTGAGYVYRTDIPEYTDANQTVTDYFVPMYTDTSGIAGIRPGGLTVSVNYRTGWSGGSWYNYTRTVPQGIYNAYLAGGHYTAADPAAPGQINCSLATVTSGVGTATQTLQPLGTFSGPGAGLSTSDVLTPLNNADGSLAVFRANGKTTFRLADSAGDIDWFVLVPVTGVAPQVTPVTDLGHSITRNAAIQWQIEDFSVPADPTTANLKVNGTAVPAAQLAVTKTNGITSLTYTSPTLFDIGKANTYQISFKATGAANTFTSTGTFMANYLPETPAGAFWIESEDFNYDGGKSNPQKGTAGLDVNVMPYLGNAYTNLSAVFGVDYVNNDNPTNSARLYRYVLDSTGVTNNILLLSQWGSIGTGEPTDIDGRSVDVRTIVGGVTNTVTQGYRIGWVDTADWCDYTRTIPAGQYQVWAALSYGDTAADECSGWLHQVSGDVTTSTQTTTELGRFDAPGTAGWGRNSLIPMKTTPDHNTPTVATNDAAVINLPGGVTTLRFQMSTGDFDYIMLVPTGSQPPTLKITAVGISGGNITIAWTGTGQLQTSADLKTWSDLPGAVTGSYTGPASDVHRFFRARK